MENEKQYQAFMEWMEQAHVLPMDRLFIKMTADKKREFKF
jgi:hypothetical protein